MEFENKEETLKRLEYNKIKLKKEQVSIFSRRGQLERFWKEQPFFYDESKSFWLWDKENYCWKKSDEINCLNLIRDLLGAETIESKARNELIAGFQQVGRIHIPKQPKKSWVQFKEKIYDIITGEIFDASPEYFITNPLPWKVGEKEDTPLIDKFLIDWVGEEHKQELYELISYAICPDRFMQRIYALCGGGSNGKCQKGDDLVLMKDGKWKKIKEVVIGDEIISPQKDETYRFVKVINTHSRFEENVYEVREKKRDKKLLYTCAGNHIIPIINRWEPRTPNGRSYKRKLFEYEAEHISKLSNKKDRICSFTTSEIGYDKEDAEINPYCLGVWLGDGHFSVQNTYRKIKNPKCDKGKHGFGVCKSLGITTKDFEIINEFKKYYPGNIRGLSKKEGNLTSTHRLSVKGKFSKELEILNLIGKNSSNKFIPKECLTSSIKYRYNLLAGLIDTNGYVNKNSAIYYTTKSKQLSEDISDLVFSLGGYCHIRKIKKKSQSGVEGDYYENSIQFSNKKRIPLKVPFKQKRLRDISRNPRNIVIECIKTKPQRVYGIEIEGDSKWYVTNNWMITHNSSCVRVVKKLLGKNNYVSTELKQLSENQFETATIYRKLLAIMGEVSVDDLKNTNMIKQISGEDSIRFCFKGKLPFTEENTCLGVCLTNSLPTTPDKSVGFYRRWMIIDFPNQFQVISKDIISEIPDKEFENLCFKCIKILKKLYKTKKFTNEGTFQEREERYEERSNPLERFIEEFCNDEPEDKITLREFTTFYNVWLKSNHLRTYTVHIVGKLIRNMGYIISKRKEFGLSNVYLLGFSLKKDKIKELYNNEGIPKLPKLLKSPVDRYKGTSEKVSSFGSFGVRPSNFNKLQKLKWLKEAIKETMNEENLVLITTEKIVERVKEKLPEDNIEQMLEILNQNGEILNYNGKWKILN